MRLRESTASQPNVKTVIDLVALKSRRAKGELGLLQCGLAVGTRVVEGGMASLFNALRTWLARVVLLFGVLS